MHRVRIHGRGGQGSKMAAKIIGRAAFIEGKGVQDFALYGSERRGAPVFSFVRVGHKGEKILEREYIEKPEYVIVLDESLIGAVDIAKGLEKNGYMLINSKKAPGYWKKKLETTAHVATLDAVKIAMEELGKPIYNTTMLGGFARQAKFLRLSSMKRALREELERYPRETVKANLKAIERAYREVKT